MKYLNPGKPARRNADSAPPAVTQGIWFSFVFVTLALQAYLARGYRGIVSYVDWNNFASLKSCARMGYHDFGNITIAGLGRHYVLHHDAGCRQYDFRLQSNGANHS